MHTAPPKLTKHATGQHRARWGGRDYYFPPDAAEARRLFLDPDSDHPGSLARWSEWRSHRDADRPLRSTSTMTVAELAKLFLTSYFNAERLDTEAYFRRHLRRFLQRFGRYRVSDITPPGIAAFVADLKTLKLGGKTIRHDVTAVKRMFAWASMPTRALCPALNLKGLELPRVRRGVPEPMEVREIKRAIARARAVYPELEPWLRLNYLAGLRPSEVCRLAYGQGTVADIPPEQLGKRRLKAIKEGQALLREHKMDRNSEHARIIPLSAEALSALRELKPLPVERRRRSLRPPRVQDWLNRYGVLCRRAGVAGIAHRLRDSAATHLLALGVAQADVDQVLGHAPTTQLANYGRTGPRLLRQIVARLTLR